MALSVAPVITRPDYTITEFIEGIYKVVRFNRSWDSPFLGYDHEGDSSYECKLDPSLSRARRVVFEIALCNRWDWFCTVTLDQEKMDRYDLKKFQTALSQKIRDWRKVYRKRGHEEKVEFLLVPEQHQDGAWHMHGLLRGIPDDALSEFVPGKHPQRLCGKGYLNWDDYSQHFGFCSLGRIKNPVACAYYIAKYITEDLNERKSELGSHLYYASQGLSRAIKVADVYGGHSALDKLLQYHFDFCSTGMTQADHGLDWTFPLEYADAVEPLDISNFDTCEDEMQAFFADFEFENMNFWGES